ncbi:MAG: glycoside hydrolase family 88 protein [Treponema sp.]|nr:glycoside hydrolase family 88 protein [Treponema sp.]
MENITTWAETVWEKIALKMSAQCDRLGASVPYAAVNGKYSDKMKENIYWWTNGFWPGMLWIMYNASKEEKYLLTARAVQERLDASLAGFEGLHHDVGFMWMLSSVLDFRLTGDKTARTRALHAASLLAGRYNPRGKFIRAWNRDCTGWIIVDSMMNLPLLYWAGKELQDPRFAFIASDHADTSLKNLVREDGSCNHIAILDPLNGALVETPAGQGYAAGSSWTRGQAWALYGFALSFRHSGEKRFLEAAERIAEYFCKEVSRFGFIPPADFKMPGDIIDTSAGSIAACGLQVLWQLTKNDEFLKNAVSILKAIEASHCIWDPAADGIVNMATAQYHGKPEERHVPLIYGDYFFMEAVNRLGCDHPWGLEINIW